jgi:hypothetical protein
MVLRRLRRLIIRAASPKKHLNFRFTQNHQRPYSNWRSDQKAAGGEWDDRENRRGFRPIVARPVDHLGGAINDHRRCDKAHEKGDKRCGLTRIITESLSLTSSDRPVSRIVYLHDPADRPIQTERRVKRSRDHQTDSRWSRTRPLTHFILLFSFIAPANLRSIFPFRP